MKTSSKKAKGRLLQKLIAELIQERFNLSPNDVKSTSMGAQGIDVQLSDKAREKFPYAIEAKNLARIAIYKHWDQAKINAKKENLMPALVIKQNHSEPLIVLNLKDFIGKIC